VNEESVVIEQMPQVRAIVDERFAGLRSHFTIQVKVSTRG